MVKPNYAFAKRQKELAKQAKAEEKRKKKAEQHADTTSETDDVMTAQNSPDTDQTV